MAKDVIARLKADTSEWDSKLSKAMQSMDRLGSDSIKMLGKMAATWLSVETAVKAFDKTIAGSQTLTDAWGRTMQASTRVVDSFFEHLAQGDMSNFLNNMDTAISKARELYDAMDTVGTFDIFAQGQRATYMADIKDAKYYIRAGIGDAEHWKEVIRDREAKMEKLMLREQGVVDDAVMASFQAITNSNAGRAMFEDLVFSEEVSPEKRQERAQQLYEKMLKDHSTVTEEWTSTFAGDISVPTMTRTRKWDSAENEELANIFRRFAQKDDQTLKAMMALWLRRENARGALSDMRRENLETLNFKGAGGGSGSFTAQNFMLGNTSAPSFGMTESMASLEEQQTRALQAIKNATTAEALRAAEEALALIQQKIEAQPIALRLNIPIEEADGIFQQMNDLSEKIRKDISLIDMKSLIPQSATKNAVADTKKITENVNDAASAFSTMGSAMQSIEDPGIRAAGLVAQAIANVASSFATALASEKNIWTWIAAAIAGTATMASTISTIKSSTAGSFADGGMIRGRAYAGDAVPIMANAGEIILNASQQQNLAGQLEPRDLWAENPPYTTGEKILLGINNHLRRIGKGEIMTTRS